MNVNQIINMIIRVVMRKGINAGVNRGIDMASRAGRRNAEPTPEDQDTIENRRDDV